MTKKAIYKPTNQQTVVLQGFEEYCEILLDGEYKSVLKTELLFESIRDDNFNKIFDAIESKEIKPKQDIFYDGQIFDAYAFVSDLIKSAKNSITLFDNYIDESVLTLLSKKPKRSDNHLHKNHLQTTRSRYKKVIILSI